MKPKGKILAGSRKPAMAGRTAPASARGRAGCSIVGVGASAGGLEAFTELLKHLPVDTGFGFVLVQHLDPQHESALAQLLTRATAMPVREVTNNLRVEANHVYIIPPNASLEIVRGVLKLQRRTLSRAAPRSIDFFFEALARDQRERAIGVILSGTATDGTLGLEAIKAEGGLTFAQDDSARYDSMPRSAAAAGCVDLVLSPSNIARELARIARHPYVAGRIAAKTTVRSRAVRAPAAGAEPAGPPEEDSYQEILLLLRNHCGVDFSLYKSTTIRRRIARRVVLNRRDTLENYAAFLRGNAKELDALYSDALINVTSFFRNADTFEVLRRKIFPRLLREPGHEPLRVWVLGCSTGQEAYSLAIVYAEAAEKIPRARPLQVFATDLNEANLEKARRGFYAKGVVQDVSPGRLRRFFAEEDGGYRVIKPLREQVVFARQNVVSDPPFSRMDLISCRNLMIYLEPVLQKKVLPTFHYALKPGGILVLGASESIGSFNDLFVPVDKKRKIFSKKAAPTQAFHLPVTRERGERRLPVATPRAASVTGRKPGTGLDPFRAELSAEREADRVVIDQFAPPGVLIDADLQILQFRGPTGAYLEPPTGKASFDLLKMARDGLMLPLREAINRAKKQNQAVRQENVPVNQGGKTRAVNVEVVPLKNLPERRYLVLFEEAGTREQAVRPEPAPHQVSRRMETSRVAGLERELAETRDYIRSIQEQQEAANEELQAANEEGQSANEELQSLNEELETSKEELESTNEELTTVNEEMVSRNAELNQLNSDLTNLQTSTKLVILLLGRDLTIRRFSVQAGKQFNLLGTDVGRPIGAIRHNLRLPDLGKFVGEVIATVRELECEVQDHDGHWFALRARPYVTLDNKVDGAVLVLMDIDGLKRTERLISEAHEHAEAIIRTVPSPLVILTAELRLQSANEAFYRSFKVAPAETQGRAIYELDGGAWNFPRLRRLLKAIVHDDTAFDGFEITREFSRIGRRCLLLNARRLKKPGGTPREILLGIRDVTEQKRAEDALRASESRFRVLFELRPVGVYACDATGRIREFNRCAVELWGRKPQLGHRRDRFCGSFKLYLPNGRRLPHRQCPMALVLNGTVPAVRDAEVRIERPDGSRITVIVNIVPLKNQRGEITGAINCFYDVTERKRAEEALREARAQLDRHAVELELLVAKRTRALLATNQRLEESVDTIRKSKEEFQALFLESQLMQKKLRQLTHQIIVAQEEERKEISRELHDGVVQTLVGINVALSALAHGLSAGGPGLRSRIARTQRLVEQSVTDVHQYARELRPAALDDLGLIPALHAYAKNLAQRHRLKIQITAFGGVEALGDAERAVLFRVAQEALTNVVRHSGAAVAKVSIAKIPGAIRMEVGDNGKSFVVERTLLAKNNTRLGLIGMKERMETVGGSLVIESHPRTGTTVRAEIPFLESKNGLPQKNHRPAG